jgi:SAM-dependent methyltransferase
MLRTMLNPARFGFFRTVLDDIRIDPAGRAALDVGCGGGLLAEEFARLGFLLTGIEPSYSSVLTAQRHAGRSGLAITSKKSLDRIEKLIDLPKQDPCAIEALGLLGSAGASQERRRGKRLRRDRQRNRALGPAPFLSACEKPHLSASFEPTPDAAHVQTCPRPPEF